MKKVYKINYVVTNKGVPYPDQTMEVSLKEKETPEQALNREVKKYKRAFDLSSGYKIEITKQEFIGYSK